MVDVLSAYGIVPVDTTAETPITVALQSNSLFPSIDLNQAGGDTIAT